MNAKITLIQGNNVMQNCPPNSVLGGSGVIIPGVFQNQKCSLVFNESVLSKHILISGATGCGKTNVFNYLIKQIKQQMSLNDVMIVFDTKGEFYSCFPDKDDKVVGNSYYYSNVTEKWNIFKEILVDAQEFRELFARYDSYAKAVCAGHILLQQGSCKLKGVYYPFCHYEGMTVRIAFRPRKTKENLAFLNSRWLLKNENFLFLNTHRVSCCKDMEFSFFVPTHEFSKMESIITACMDELLTIYSRLKLKGYIAG